MQPRVCLVAAITLALVFVIQHTQARSSRSRNENSMRSCKRSPAPTTRSSDSRKPPTVSSPRSTHSTSTYAPTPSPCPRFMTAQRPEPTGKFSVQQEQPAAARVARAEPVPRT